MGGAGLYTAIAARAAAAEVTLLAPRPASIDAAQLSPRSNFFWIGPACSDLEFPHLEIRHHGNDQATLVAASWGAESMLTPQLLPSDIQKFDIVHIAALSSAEKQLEFHQAIRAKSKCKISAGTYAKIAYGETDLVRRLFSNCDFVFMNENESKAIYNEADYPLKANDNRVICITKGRNGAQVFSKDIALDLPGLVVEELDPTGAGDTFAGTFLAAIAQQNSIEQSAALAIERSALVITKPGPSAITALIK